MEITGVTAEQALDEFRQRLAAEAENSDNDKPLADPDGDMVALLVRGAHARSEELDGYIDQSLNRDWTVERLESVLRAILRCGAFELAYRPQTPIKVAISEYVDVAHAFYSGPEPGLVNAVMDKVARLTRSEDFQEKSGA